MKSLFELLELPFQIEYHDLEIQGFSALASPGKHERKQNIYLHGPEDIETNNLVLEKGVSTMSL